MDGKTFCQVVEIPWGRMYHIGWYIPNRHDDPDATGVFTCALNVLQASIIDLRFTKMDNMLTYVRHGNIFESLIYRLKEQLDNWKIIILCWLQIYDDIDVSSRIQGQWPNLFAMQINHKRNPLSVHLSLLGREMKQHRLIAVRDIEPANNNGLYKP